MWREWYIRECRFIYHYILPFSHTGGDSSGGSVRLLCGDGVFQLCLCLLAFPDGDDGPGRGGEAQGNVAPNLLFLEFGVRFWCDVLGSAEVGMRKAAVDEDESAAPGQHKVRLNQRLFKQVSPMPMLANSNAAFIKISYVFPGCRL